MLLASILAAFQLLHCYSIAAPAGPLSSGADVANTGSHFLWGRISDRRVKLRVGDFEATSTVSPVLRSVAAKGDILPKETPNAAKKNNFMEEYFALNERFYYPARVQFGEDGKPIEYSVDESDWTLRGRLERLKNGVMEFMKKHTQSLKNLPPDSIWLIEIDATYLCAEQLIKLLDVINFGSGRDVEATSKVSPALQILRETPIPTEEGRFKTDLNALMKELRYPGNQQLGKIVWDHSYISKSREACVQKILAYKEEVEALLYRIYEFQEKHQENLTPVECRHLEIYSSIFRHMRDTVFDQFLPYDLQARNLENFSEHIPVEFILQEISPKTFQHMFNGVMNDILHSSLAFQGFSD